MSADHDLPLAGLAAGSLPPDEAARTAAHAATCPRCAAELAEWRTLRAALAAGPKPAPDTLTAVQLRVAAARTPAHPVRFARLLQAEAPVVRRQVWAASALVLLLGALIAMFGAGRDGTYLALVAPAVAAAGVAYLYGPAADPSFELALATPTPPLLILLARLTLVFGFDLLLALAVSALLAAGGQVPGGVEALVLRWLGPMLMLSALSLCVALRAGPVTGMGVAMGLWLALIAAGPVVDRTLAGATTLLTETSPATLGAAAGLAALLVVGMPRATRLPA